MWRHPTTTSDRTSAKSSKFHCLLLHWMRVFSALVSYLFTVWTDCWYIFSCQVRHLFINGQQDSCHQERGAPTRRSVNLSRRGETKCRLTFSFPSLYTHSDGWWLTGTFRVIVHGNIDDLMIDERQKVIAYWIIDSGVTLRYQQCEAMKA